MEKYDFGNRLYEYRTQKGLTQKELGKLLGVTDKAVSKWETGESKPRLDKMAQITELFETSIDGMLGKESSADRQQLKPYKTIFDLRLKKYSKLYKALRIVTYIWAVVCVIVSVLLVFYDAVNEGLAFERIGAIAANVALSGAAVILTASFKSKIDEHSGKNINKFSSITTLLFLIPNALTALFHIRVGKAAGEYNTFFLSLLAMCCLAVIITLLICVIKQKGYDVLAGILISVSILEALCIDSYYLRFLFLIILLALQLYIHKEINNWLALAEKAELEIKRQIGGKRSTKVFISVVAVIVALCTVFSAFSPYFVYKILLYKLYPEGDRIKRVEYDYSAEFKDGEYYEYSFKGASFKIPNGFEIVDNVNLEDAGVFFKDKNKNMITVDYFDSDYMLSDEFELEDEDSQYMEYMNYMYKKYFGVPLLSTYGMNYYNYAVDVTDVKFYETKKAALLLMPMVTQKILSQTSFVDSSIVYNNGEYCGFISSTSFIVDGKPSDYKVRLADVWHVYDLEGAYYHIMYTGKGKTDEEIHQLICKFINSLEF